MFCFFNSMSLFNASRKINIEKWSLPVTKVGIIISAYGNIRLNDSRHSKWRSRKNGNFYIHSISSTFVAQIVVWTWHIFVLFTRAILFCSSNYNVEIHSALSHSALIDDDLFYFFDNHSELLEMEFYCGIHLARTSGTFKTHRIKSSSALCLWKAREWLASTPPVFTRKKFSPQAHQCAWKRISKAICS